MDQPTTTDTAPMWAILELMGHIRYGGRVIAMDNVVVAEMGVAA